MGARSKMDVPMCLRFFWKCIFIRFLLYLNILKNTQKSVLFWEETHEQNYHENLQFRSSQFRGSQYSLPEKIHSRSVLTDIFSLWALGLSRVFTLHSCNLVCFVKCLVHGGLWAFPHGMVTISRWVPIGRGWFLHWKQSGGTDFEMSNNWGFLCVWLRRWWIC